VNGSERILLHPGVEQGLWVVATAWVVFHIATSRGAAGSRFVERIFTATTPLLASCLTTASGAALASSAPAWGNPTWPELRARREDTLDRCVVPSSSGRFIR
jgi:hypothetical protein